MGSRSDPGLSRRRRACRGRTSLLFVTLLAALSATGCSTLLEADPTPVPGAAATLTRSERTPIPTPVRTTGPAPLASPSPSRVAAAASAAASPVASGQAISDDEVAQLQQRIERVLASPTLPDIESLLLDHVSLSTTQGGSVLDRAGAAAWLRDHAAGGIKVTTVDRSTQTVMLHVQTDGWPSKDPIAQGQVSFSLRRYDASGRTDEEKGDWQVDVIDVE